MEDKNYVGRHIKALVNEPEGGFVKKGEIGLIVDLVDTCYIANFPSQQEYYINHPIDRNLFEVIEEEEETTITTSQSEDFYPLAPLRWVEKDIVIDQFTQKREKVLQQLYRSYLGNVEWRDVPFEII